MRFELESSDWTFEWEYDKKVNYIWWFEEPEYSYEYSNSIRLANNFVWIWNKSKDEEWNYIQKEWKFLYEDINYSSNKQIFITTHSEEFLRLFEENDLESKISMYLVYKILKKKENYSYSWIDEILKDELNKIHNKLWLENIARSKLIFDIKHSLHEKEISEEKLKEIINENRELKSYNERIKNELLLAKKESKTLIYCENKNADILNKIWIKNVIFAAWKDKRSVFDSSKDTLIKAFWLIDRYFLTDWEIEILEKYTNTRILRYYCFENYLYHPDNLDEYFKLNKATFNKKKYIAKILTEVDSTWNTKLNRDTISINRRDWYSDLTLFVVCKTGNLTSLETIEHDFNSKDFNKIYKYYTMKKKKSVFSELNNLDDIKLSKTKWFKDSITNIIKDFL